ncbi:hypothetical protein CALCODRAFT_379536 [Calocera cornea HHB12733]|uniref:Uncharacterized protein n=1 Tax=Calocera cornea HHB12733 TaxID=1353952 RepID=A0A165EDV4_9BASI|nr:hypothetical protein CALCODRAFT_379536 [Calocera cornea HHB12733]
MAHTDPPSPGFRCPPSGRERTSAVAFQKHAMTSARLPRSPGKGRGSLSKRVCLPGQARAVPRPAPATRGRTQRSLGRPRTGNTLGKWQTIHPHSARGPPCDVELDAAGRPLMGPGIVQLSASICEHPPTCLFEPEPRNAGSGIRVLARSAHGHLLYCPPLPTGCRFRRAAKIRGFPRLASPRSSACHSLFDVLNASFHRNGPAAVCTHFHFGQPRSGSAGSVEDGPGPSSEHHPVPKRSSQSLRPCPYFSSPVSTAVIPGPGCRCGGHRGVRRCTGYSMLRRRLCIPTLRCLGRTRPLHATRGCITAWPN